MSNEFGNTEEVKQLPQQFAGKGEVSGYYFKQLKCSNKAFIYEIHSTNSLQYEVFVNKYYKKYNCLAYPKAKSFGLWAWTYLDYNSALKKYNQLNSCD